MRSLRASLTDQSPAFQGDFKDISPEEIRKLGVEALKTDTVEDLARRSPKEYRAKGIGHYYNDSDEMKAGVAVWGALMAEGGWLGDLMRTREPAVILGEGACKTLFIHGGLTAQILDVRRRRLCCPSVSSEWLCFIVSCVCKPPSNHTPLPPLLRGRSALSG